MQQQTPKETKCHWVLLSLSPDLRKLHCSDSQWWKVNGYKVCMESNNSGLKQVNTLKWKIFIHDKVGTDGDSGFKFPHWKSVGLTPRGSSESEKHDGRTCVLLHLAPTQSEAVRLGCLVLHGLCMVSASQRRHNAQKIWTETAREALPTYNGFHKSLLLSWMTQHCCTVIAWHQLLVIWVGAFLYVFNRNLLTLPFLAVTTCAESTFQWDPVKI